MKNNPIKLSKKTINLLNEKYRNCLFRRPLKQYTLDRISIKERNSDIELLSVISSNSFRAFHKINKKGKGPKCLITEYFHRRHLVIKSELLKVNNREDLDKISNKFSLEIKNALKNIQPSSLKSYNKTRKLVDLYFEHLVLLTDFLSESKRNLLLPLLFVPLDSQILVRMRSEFKVGMIPSKPSMGSVVSKELYDKIQICLSSFCDLNGISAPITLDLLWRDRYLKKGNNFLELTIAAINS
jgi:hypothetical protein